MVGPSSYVTLRRWLLAENTEAENWVSPLGASDAKNKVLLQVAKTT